jgi:hypothetical protein
MSPSGVLVARASSPNSVWRKRRDGAGGGVLASHRGTDGREAKNACQLSIAPSPHKKRGAHVSCAQRLYCQFLSNPAPPCPVRTFFSLKPREGQESSIPVRSGYQRRAGSTQSNTYREPLRHDCSQTRTVSSREPWWSGMRRTAPEEEARGGSSVCHDVGVKPPCFGPAQHYALPEADGLSTAATRRTAQVQQLARRDCDQRCFHYRAMSVSSCLPDLKSSSLHSWLSGCFSAPRLGMRRRAASRRRAGLRRRAPARARHTRRAARGSRAARAATMARALNFRRASGLGSGAPGNTTWGARS